MSQLSRRCRTVRSRRQVVSGCRQQRRLLVESLEDRRLLSIDASAPWDPINGLDVGAFYYADGQRIELALQADEFAIKFKDSVASEVLAQYAGERTPSGFEAVEPVTSGVYLIKGDSVQLDGLRDESVAWTTPTYALAATGEKVLVLDEAVVALQPGVVPEEVFGKGVVSYRPLLGTPDQFVVTLEEAGRATLDYANGLMADERVAWATPNFYQNMEKMFIPNDPLFPNQWHLNNTGSNSGVPGALAGADVKAVAAWNLSTGSGVTIALLDDGIERSHPDLAANIFVNPGEIANNGIDDDGNGWVDDVSGWSFVGAGSPNPTLGSGNEHGTATSGIAVGRGNNSLGVAGSAFNAKILPVQMFDGSTYVGDANTASAVYYAAGRTANGLGTWNVAQVINCSWGGGAPARR